MLRGQNKKIIMAEGDFGLSLPITIVGDKISEDESLKFYIKSLKGEDMIEPKIFHNIINNTIELSFTKNESEKLLKGTYLYYLDWYKENEFLGNIVNAGLFEVEGK